MCIKKSFSFFLLFYLSFFPLFSQEQRDPLPSWKEGKNKQRILDFVEKVTNPLSSNFVPPKDRIATFDNDGTLWVEKPNYTQVDFTIERFLSFNKLGNTFFLGQNDASSKGFLNLQDLRQMTEKQILEWAMWYYSGVSEDDFNQEIKFFFAHYTHPDFHLPYTSLVYQPMLEFIDYLRSKDFKIFICTGGDSAFVRVIAEELYGVPPENVIGTQVAMELETQQMHSRLIRTKDMIYPVNEKEGKVINIQRYIGKKPVIAVGNSDGDFHMLAYTADPYRGPFLSVLVRHDDPIKEYAYDTRSEKTLQFAQQQKWVVVSMKNDFKRVFPFEQLVSEEIPEKTEF